MLEAISLYPPRTQRVVHSVAAAASLVVSTGPCVLKTLAGYNAKGSAQFIQVFDAASLPSDDVSGVAEVSAIDFNGATPAGLGGTVIQMYDATGAVALWFNLDSGNVAPTGLGRAVAIAIATGDTDTQLATKAKNVIHVDAGLDASISSKVVTITDRAAGARVDIRRVTPALTLAVSTAGVNGVAEQATVDFTSATPASLAGMALRIYDGAGSVCLWFSLDGGNVDPRLGLRSVVIPITTGQTVAQLAEAFKVVVDNEAAFTASRSTNVVTIVQAATGTRTDLAKLESGLTVATTVGGVDAVAEQSTIDFASATPTGLANKSFLLHDSAGTVGVWFNKDAGGVNPASGARMIAVAITTGMSDTQIAQAAKTAIDADALFTAAGAAKLITVTNTEARSLTDIVDVDSSLTLATTVQGVTATAEQSTIDFNGKTAAGLAGQGVTLADAAGAVYIWFDRGGLTPDPLFSTRGIRVLLTDAMTDTDIAEAAKLAVDADAAYTSTRSSKIITIVDIATGPRTNIAALATGLTVATTVAGVNGVAEASTLDFASATPATLAGSAVLLYDSGGKVCLWFNLDGGNTDPALGLRSIAVPIVTGMIAQDMAEACKVALLNDLLFDASRSGTVVTVTNLATGTRTDIAAVIANVAGVSVTTPGVDAVSNIPLLVINAATVANFHFHDHIPPEGLLFNTGCVVCNSSTYAKKTIGSADCFFSAVLH